MLPLTVEEGDLSIPVMTLFTVVTAPSSYNIILGKDVNFQHDLTQQEQNQVRVGFFWFMSIRVGPAI